MKRTISPSTLALAAVLALSPGLALAQDANALDQVEGRNAYLERAVKSVATETSRFVAEVKTARGKHLGFGVVIDGGYVLTSNDILAPGDLVVGVGGRDQAATVAGRDLRNDVALLRVQWQTEAPAGIPLGSSKDVPIGAIVYVGGILDGPVLAAGVVSAKNRRVEPSAQQGNILMGLFSDGNSGHKRAFPSVVHHDAPLQPEHFGAPLIDATGHLLGINVANPFRGSSHAVGIDSIVAVLPDLKAGLTAEAPAPQPHHRAAPQGKRAWLGISAAPAPAERLALDYRYGIEVRDVEGPAKAAHLEAGDVIVALDGKAFADIESFAGRLSVRAPGEKVKLTILHGKAGLVREVEVTLGTRPE